MIRGLDDGEIAGMLGSDEELIRAQREDVVREVAARIEPATDGAEIPELEAVVAGAVEREARVKAEAEIEAEPEIAPEPEIEAEPVVEPEPAPEAELEPVVEAAPEPELEPEHSTPDPLAAFLVPEDEVDDRPTGEHEAVRPDWLDEPEYQPRDRDPEPSSRRRTLIIVAGLVAVLAVIVGIQRAGGGSDDSSTPTPAPSTPAPQQQAAKPAPKPTTAPASAPKAKTEKLAAVGKTAATGTIAVDNGRLTMNVKGLPNGTYTVWLYNSVIDSKPIKTVTGTSIKLNAKLPADAKNYKFIDVSAQPAGSENHSGESVLRTATP